MSYITSFEREGLEKGLRKGLEQGLQQGREKERFEMAKKLLAEGLSVEIVKKVTRLSDLDLNALELEKV